jgi:hypothetical protein
MYACMHACLYVFLLSIILRDIQIALTYNAGGGSNCIRLVGLNMREEYENITQIQIHVTIYIKMF